MNRKELFILIAVIIMVFIMFIVYATVSLFNAPEPTPSAFPASPGSPKPSVEATVPSAPSFPSAAPPSLPPGTTGLSKEELVDLLPIQADTFDVEYLSVSDHFVVTIKKDPYAANKAAAETWFKGLGLDPQNLNIYWQVFPNLKRK